MNGTSFVSIVSCESHVNVCVCVCVPERAENRESKTKLMKHLFESKYLSLNPGLMGINGPPHFVPGPWALKRM